MISEKIKILVLGIGQSNFLDQLYGGVAKETDRFKFSIDGYHDFSKGINKSSRIYSNHYDFKTISISKTQRRLSLLKFAKKKLFYEVLFFEISQKSSYKKIKKLLFNLAVTKHRVDKINISDNFNIYHFHFCTPNNLMMIYFLPKEANIICSFWGSDLMRSTGVSNVFYVQKALSKAKQITVQTPEMAEMLYCKYGRKFTSKTTNLRFTIDENIYREIDIMGNDEDELSGFRNKYSIPSNKTIIAIGHNAFEENNHLQIIQALADLPDTILEQCVFLLHLSYGGNKKYIDKLIHLVQAQERMSFIFIHDFLGSREIALLRNCVNILIQMPISDALSGAMTEVLYAGNQVIAGGWLPYGFFRRSKIDFFEVDNFSQIPLLLTSILQNRKNEAMETARSQKNKENIRRNFFPSQTTPEWIKLFETVAKPYQI